MSLDGKQETREVLIRWGLLYTGQENSEARKESEELRYEGGLDVASGHLVFLSCLSLLCCYLDTP